MKTYKLNNIEVSESELKKLIQANPELWDIQIKEEEKSRYFTPGIDEEYFSINSINQIVPIENTNSTVYDSVRIAYGAYRTVEEAELARDKQLALVRMWNYADEQMFFRPDWGNEMQDKYYASYDFRINKFVWTHNRSIKFNFLLPYLESEKDCEQFIKDNQKDLELFIK